MPNIDLSILNQRATPAFFADTLANRPAAGFIGRIFVSTDTYAFYRDNGTGWDLIGGPGTGTITGTGASGQIALWNGASTITGDTGLTYDGTANSLTADKFIVSGGTSSQFLKANGSVDSNSYVPYTGANASLNMGANNLLGQNYFINGDNVSSGGYLGIKQFNGSSSGSNGYTSISALQQNSLYFQFSQTNGTNKVFELSTGLLGTTIRQFLLPDADGTLALTSNIPSVSGVAGQVSYFNGTNSITGNNNLFYDTALSHLGINTNTPGSALDVHDDQSTLVQLNQTTATNDTRIGFQNSGTALWRIGNFYNAGANDWGIFDVVGAAQPFTIKKTTGQTFIGAETTTSGRLVVNNATGDNHIVVIGATAPSIRINNAGSGATRQIGIGLATTTNNFIQGATGGEMAIFNSNTTASPILFGIYDAGLSNTQEAARISASRNLLVGTTTDNGNKLQVNGSANFTGSGLFSSNLQTNGVLTIGNQFTAGNYFLQITPSTTNRVSMQGLLSGVGISDIIMQSSGGNVGIGNWSSNIPQDTLHVNGAIQVGFVNSLNNAMRLFWNGASTYGAIQTASSSILALNPSGNNVAIGNTSASYRLQSFSSSYQVALTNPGYGSWLYNVGTDVSMGFVLEGTGEAARFSSARNLLIGTTTDDGSKLQVKGNVKFGAGNGNRAILDSNDSVITLAPGGTTDFDSFSGMLLVCNHNTGAFQIFVCGGGSTASVYLLGGAMGTFTYNLGINGYTFTNNTASTYIYNFTAFRTRNNA